MEGYLYRNNVGIAETAVLQKTATAKMLYSVTVVIIAKKGNRKKRAGENSFPCL